MRAPIRYYGGKGNLCKQLLPLLPRAKVYVEPYMGAASLFWNKLPSPVEVLNDLSGDVVNLFRCLQDKDTFAELSHKIRYTLYSRAEFGRALEVRKDANASPIDRAWATFVAFNQGFGGNQNTIGNWGRVFISEGGMADTTNKWVMRLAMLDDWHKRLLAAQIDNQDALTVIQYWDSEDTVFYLDPPYVADSRVKGNTEVYDHECDDDHHRKLVEILLAIKGQALLSGYNHEIYRPLEDAGWIRHDFQTACYAASKGRGSKLRGKGSALKHAARTECCWVTNRTVMGLWQ